MASAEAPTPGLRERKKARTRATIQQHALRLFRDQGYNTTTVRQIAEAAEISESTFFRYFPTKEEVVVWDDLDLRGIATLIDQPAKLSPIQALRATFRQLFEGLSTDQHTELRERIALMMTIPPLRATLLDQIDASMRQLTEAVAVRTGRPPDGHAVRTLVGAVIGVGLTIMFTVTDDPDADIGTLVDEAMAQLEAGLPLQAP